MRKSGCFVGLIAIACVAALALAFVGSRMHWCWSRMQWLETGAGFPRELEFSETLYAHMEVEFCAEAVFRLDEVAAQDIDRRGLSFLADLGSNREGEAFDWRAIESDEDVRAPTRGPLCFGGGPPNTSRDWPTLPSDLGAGYVARDDHGSTLIVYPEARVAYYWSQ